MKNFEIEIALCVSRRDLALFCGGLILPFHQTTIYPCLHSFLPLLLLPLLNSLHLSFHIQRPFIEIAMIGTDEHAGHVVRMVNIELFKAVGKAGALVELPVVDDPAAKTEMQLVYRFLLWGSFEFSLGRSIDQFVELKKRISHIFRYVYIKKVFFLNALVVFFFPFLIGRGILLGMQGT
jgi:hypothetical protein